VRVPDEIQKPEILAELGDDERDTIKPGISVHREEDIEKVKRRVDLEQVLQKAIVEKSFDVHFQPIWNADTSLFDSAEALVRLNDANFGNIPPMEFIPIAEQNGMINDIGRIVFEKVCQFLHENQPEKFGLKEIEVNLSIFQLFVEDTDILFRSIMEKYGVTSKQINLEVTESASLMDNEIVKEHYESLRRLGFTFSLDDFGTGYSNLIQVIYNDFKNIKSDKGLLWDTKNPNSHKFLVETINMIRKFRLNVIHEGVETKEQLELVLKAGANKIQGYYFSKPLESSEFLSFIRVHNASTNPLHA
jgi:EAL domain-containing protein (putative c-di-GMP-specific phosphodiesterase class I)